MLIQYLLMGMLDDSVGQEGKESSVGSLRVNNLPAAALRWSCGDQAAYQVRG